jgi:UTP--glucose-1-phosphate uridylyltransferase
MCERINEEKEDINVEISGQLEVLSPTTRLADFDHLSIYKRHHRPRPILLRSSSSPNLIDILLSDHPISLNQPHPHPPPLPPPPKKSQRRSSAKNGMATLIPRNDSFNARTRGASHIDFRTATTGVIGKAMRNELSQLVNTVQDSKTRKASLISTIYPTSLLIFLHQAFDTEMQSFFYLFTRYLAERAQAQELSASLFLSSQTQC